MMGEGQKTTITPSSQKFKNARDPFFQSSKSVEMWILLVWSAEKIKCLGFSLFAQRWREEWQFLADHTTYGGEMWARKNTQAFNRLKLETVNSRNTTEIRQSLVFLSIYKVWRWSRDRQIQNTWKSHWSLKENNSGSVFPATPLLSVKRLNHCTFN